MNICSGNDIPDSISSFSDNESYQNEFKSAINVRDPVSYCKNEMSDNLGSSDFSVQTSEIPCSMFPDTKFAQHVSNINSSQIMNPNAAYELKSLCKRFNFDSFSDVYKIPLNLMYFSWKFIFLFGFLLSFIVGVGFSGSTESTQYELK